MDTKPQRFGRTWLLWLILSVISFALIFIGVALGFGALTTNTGPDHAGFIMGGVFASFGIFAMLSNLFASLFCIAVVVRIIDYAASRFGKSSRETTS